MDNPNLLSPSVLSFVGDAVYGLYVRTYLAEVNRPSGELHKASVRLVNATAQAEAFALIEPQLTEKELSVYKRGRNAHTKHKAKKYQHNRTAKSVKTGKRAAPRVRFPADQKAGEKDGGRDCNARPHHHAPSPSVYHDSAECWAKDYC